MTKRKHLPRVGVPLQVEAKYPALLFKQQLDAFVQKIFPMLRDNVKKEITPQLAACIHAPRQAGVRGLPSAPTMSRVSVFLSAGSPRLLGGPWGQRKSPRRTHTGRACHAVLLTQVPGAARAAR